MEERPRWRSKVWWEKCTHLGGMKGGGCRPPERELGTTSVLSPLLLPIPQRGPLQTPDTQLSACLPLSLNSFCLCKIDKPLAKRILGLRSKLGQRNCSSPFSLQRRLCIAKTEIWKYPKLYILPKGCRNKSKLFNVCVCAQSIQSCQTHGL